MADSVHVAVLLDEVLELFCRYFPREGENRFFDGTFGGGGHTLALLRAFPNSSVTAFDRDLVAVRRAETKAWGGRLEVIHARFSELEERGLGHFDGFLIDLGVSSDQLEDQSRGFSFRSEYELDSRMDQSQGVRAHELLNELSEEELSEVFVRGGVRRNAKKLAKRVIFKRPILNGRQFAEICCEVLDSPRERRLRGAALDTHPATVPLQAIRIEVNQELREIECFLAALPRLARPGGLVVFLTFHSLEDELVTRKFREWARPERSRRFGELKSALGAHLTQKPVLPREEELARNPRSRSAKLRAFRFRGGED